jgi:ribonuclease HI
MDVWEACAGKIQKSVVAGNTIVEVLEYLVELCNSEELAMLVEIARRIWLRRNSVVHGVVFVLPNEVIRSATSFIVEYREAMEKERLVVDIDRTPCSSAVVRWKPPLPGCLKINWDTARDSHSRSIGFGLLVRNSNGLIYATGSLSMRTLMDPVAVKAFVALRALEFCRSRGYSNIMLEGDSLEVVKSINNSGLNWTRIGPIVSDIKEVMRSFSNWQVGHIKKEGNVIAHKLAKFGIQHGFDRIWLDCLPDCIREVVLSEFSTLSV